MNKYTFEIRYRERDTVLVEAENEEAAWAQAAILRTRLDDCEVILVDVEIEEPVSNIIPFRPRKK